MPAARKAIAYLDRDVPVNDASAPRALIKPMVFAKLLQAAGIAATDRVLDVGCATGYSSAVLGKLAASVVALEEDAALAATAAEALAASGARNVAVASGPLSAGWPDEGPYDVIVLQGASEVVPDSLLGQLNEGGRLLAVIGSGPMGKATIYRMAAHARDAAAAVRRRSAAAAGLRQAAGIRFLAATTAPRAARSYRSARLWPRCATPQLLSAPDRPRGFNALTGAPMIPALSGAADGHSRRCSAGGYGVRWCRTGVRWTVCAAAIAAVLAASHARRRNAGIGTRAGLPQQSDAECAARRLARDR